MNESSIYSPCEVGCTGFLEAISSIEATTITKLREQGAIILGIANGSQWANTRFTPGWSAVGGQCLGIYYKDQHPRGSSSGSAVGTALGLCAAALGSEVCQSATPYVVLGLIVESIDFWQCDITCAEVCYCGSKTNGRTDFEIWTAYCE